MRNFLLNLAFLVIAVFIAVFFFGEKLIDVVKEIVIVYASLFVIAVALAIYLGLALQRAMRPKFTKEDKNG